MSRMKRPPTFPTRLARREALARAAVRNLRFCVANQRRYRDKLNDAGAYFLAWAIASHSQRAREYGVEETAIAAIRRPDR